MTCYRINNGFVCIEPFFRLRLEDGRYIFMAWHHWCGPMFFHDKNEQREVERWWDDEVIVKALNWFQKRGNKA